MTDSPDTPPLEFDSLEAAVSALRERGLRLSTARRLILEALFAAEGPVSAAYLAESLSIDESSVYRNLEVLESHGVSRHVHLGHGPGLYVLLGHGEVEYLYCSRCAKVAAMAPADLDGVRHEIARATGYETRFHHFALVGLCGPCSAETGSAPDAVSVNAATATNAHSHGDFVHSHSHRGAQHEHRH